MIPAGIHLLDKNGWNFPNSVRRNSIKLFSTRVPIVPRTHAIKCFSFIYIANIVWNAKNSSFFHLSITIIVQEVLLQCALVVYEVGSPTRAWSFWCFRNCDIESSKLIFEIIHLPSGFRFYKYIVNIRCYMAKDINDGKTSETGNVDRRRGPPPLPIPLSTLTSSATSQLHVGTSSLFPQNSQLQSRSMYTFFFNSNDSRCTMSKISMFWLYHALVKTQLNHRAAGGGGNSSLPAQMT
jgi:hypothetical protein